LYNNALASIFAFAHPSASLPNHSNQNKRPDGRFYSTLMHLWKHFEWIVI
jgi:hypothetical protein